MRRFLFGMVIASMTVAAPAWVVAGDREIAQAIMTRLEQQKAEGRLKGFDIDLEVKQGTVYLRGSVSNQQQYDDVTSAAKQASGVAEVVNELTVNGAKPAAPAAKPFSLVEAVKGLRPSETAVQTASANEQTTVGDEQVTDAIISQLSQEKNAGTLRGFQLDVRTVKGETWVGGRVASQSQKDLVIDIIRRTQGVQKVIDDVVVQDNGVRSVSNEAPVPVGSMPVVGQAGAPRPFARSMLASQAVEGAVDGAPVPMQGGGGVPYGVGVPRYDQPYMPSYAWPSYAAYPNYAAVTYPKQYSPSAWPYIGPFYPYPQVPLGWRKVTLEWDDGLWYLDFQSK